MKLTDLASQHSGTLSTADETHPDLIQKCRENDDIATHLAIGTSRKGRALDAFIIGNGPVTVSIISGSHADEPVGSETLRLLVAELVSDTPLSTSLRKRCRFLLIPQINPDSEIINSKWMRRWPDIGSYILHAYRELPGDDIEFGYPGLRPENKAAADFWAANGPVDVHLSLHGMGYAEGVMLLIERHWTSRTQRIRDHYTAAAANLGLGLHTHNRKGEKGFFYIEDGYMTTPEGAAMRAHFQGLGDYETASLFHQSSMEYMRTISDDPLCLVTEIPLFALRHSGSDHMVPENYIEFKKRLPTIRSVLERGEVVDRVFDDYDVKAVPLQHAIELQLLSIQLAIETVEEQLKLKQSSK